MSTKQTKCRQPAVKCAHFGPDQSCVLIAFPFFACSSCTFPYPAAVISGFVWTLLKLAGRRVLLFLILLSADLLSLQYTQDRFTLIGQINGFKSYPCIFFSYKLGKFIYSFLKFTIFTVSIHDTVVCINAKCIKLTMLMTSVNSH